MTPARLAAGPAGEPAGQRPDHGPGPAAVVRRAAGRAAGHGHLVCEKCGAMAEVPDAIFAGLVRAVRDGYGFAINSHRFAVTGRCAACA